MDLESLSDADLRSRCSAKGIKVGPLTATTKKLYLKKLREAENNSAGTAVPNGTSTPIKVPRTRDKTPKRNKTETNNIPSIDTHSTDTIPFDLDPSQLDDDGLRDVMRRLNIRFGPVNAMTRKIYYKKIRAAQGAQNGTHAEFSTDDDEANGQIKPNGLGTNGTPARQGRPKKKRDSPQKPAPPAAQEAYSTSESESESEEDSSSVSRHDMGTSVMSDATLNDSFAPPFDSPAKTNGIHTPLRDRNNPENTRPSQTTSSDANIAQNNISRKVTSVISPLATSNETVERSKSDCSQVSYITKARGTPQVRKRTIEEVKPGRNEPGPATLAAYNRLNGTATFPPRGPGEQPERKRAKNVAATKNSEEIRKVKFANMLPMIGIAIFAIICGSYCWKTGISIFPDISSDIGEVPADSPIEMPSSIDMKNKTDELIGTTIIDIFYIVQQETADQICRVQNILTGPVSGDKSVHQSQLTHLDGEVKSRALDLIMKDAKVSKIMNIDEEGYISVESSSLELGLFCRAIVATSSRYIEIRWGLIVAIALVILRKVFCYFQAKRKTRKIEVAQMMKETIDVLQNNSARHGSNRGIKRENVRDQIVPLGDNCKHNIVIWNECEKTLKADSRLTVDQKVDNGEESEIWRWTESTDISGEWQGKAFDTRGPSGADIPAECLKIRNMFEPGERDPQIKNRVINSLKDRCSGVNGILHIDFAIPDGVAYVKCASKEKAGLAYQKISGSWYNKKLVSVKYILLDRYHKRFPKSITSTDILA